MPCYDLRLKMLSAGWVLQTLEVGDEMVAALIEKVGRVPYGRTRCFK